MKTSHAKPDKLSLVHTNKQTHVRLLGTRLMRKDANHIRLPGCADKPSSSRAQCGRRRTSFARATRLL